MISWPRFAIFHDSSIASPRRSSIASSRSRVGPDDMPLTTVSKRFFETWASITYWRHGSLSVCGATFADERAADRLGPTAAAATRTPHAPSPTAAAPRSGTPARMATAVPPPNNPMPSGDAAAATDLALLRRWRGEPPAQTALAACLADQQAVVRDAVEGTDGLRQAGLPGVLRRQLCMPMLDGGRVAGVLLLMERFGVSGTTRASFACFNTIAEVDAMMAATKKAVKMLR